MTEENIYTTENIEQENTNAENLAEDASSAEFSEERQENYRLTQEVQNLRNRSTE